MFVRTSQIFFGCQGSQRGSLHTVEHSLLKHRTHQIFIYISHACMCICHLLGSFTVPGGSANDLKVS